MVSLFFGGCLYKKKSENTCSFEIVTFLKFKIGRMYLLEIFFRHIIFLPLVFLKKMTHHLKRQYSISEEETEEL